MIFPKRIWLAYAPPGQWSSGASVIYDWKGDGTEPENVVGYKSMNWTVEGPYILEESA